MKPVVVHMFWAYGTLSRLERLCAASFRDHGFHVLLWGYGPPDNAPPGIYLRDARELVPEDRVFTYANGSYAAFADLFRYKVLSCLGGLYADTDVVCLLPADRLPEWPFLVSERRKAAPLAVNNNVIWSPRPRAGDIVDLALAVTERFPVDALEWGDCGPTLLTALAGTYPKLAFRVMPPQFANPIDYWDCPGALLSPRTPSIKGTGFLHCYNELWRRVGIDKEAAFPEGSLLAELSRRYLGPD